MLRNLCPQYVVFQFHKGTIKPIRPILITFILIDFNSIKVQLSLLLLVHHEALSVFQFHKGTIKPMSTYSSYVSFSYFNSIKVQLSRVFTERNIFGI